MHAAHHADRHGNQRGDRNQDQRPDDRVSHPAAHFADRLRQLGEERDVERGEALAHDVEEDHRQRHECEQHRRTAEGDDGVGNEFPHAGTTRRVSKRENALTMMVMRNSTSPISTSACRYSSSAASVNSLAMTAAIVYCGAKSEALICGLLPMTIVTAIVSPSARPRPSITAPMIPVRP